MSPYADKPSSAWLKVTQKLLEAHPLRQETILAVATEAWGALWKTRIGTGDTAIRLKDLTVPATVVGYFFEVLFAKELARRFPSDWRGCQQGDEKDLVYIRDPAYSVEIKTSGQLGLKVYGNRSYGQQLQNKQLAKKEKSGYYITVNFFKQRLTLIRFGWIDASDWKPQASPTGQMAGLPDDVYRFKLVTVLGDYQRLAPLQILAGIGSKTAAELAERGIATIGDLLRFKDVLPAKILAIREAIKSIYSGT
jgi:ScaI restriction endonuclease